MSNDGQYSSGRIINSNGTSFASQKKLKEPEDLSKILGTHLEAEAYNKAE